MIAIARFTVALGDAAQFESDLSIALGAFSSCAGFIKGDFGQNLDDVTLWSLVTHWENVGSHRYCSRPFDMNQHFPNGSLRTLSNNDVKMHAIPTLARCIDEPGAYQRP